MPAAKTQNSKNPLGSDPGELTIDTFRGTNAEFQAFVERVWSRSYAGKMAYPIWSTEYFDWQFARQGSDPDRRLAAYESDRVVAVLAGTPYCFQTPTEHFYGSHWSWLSVEPDYRGRGLSKALDQQRIEIERQSGSDLIVSYRFSGSKHSLAEKPSIRFPLKRFHSRVGFWARPLAPDRLSRWNVNRVEGFLGRLAAPLLPKLSELQVSGPIRWFEPTDLPDCLRILREQTAACGLSIRWDEASLRHQLAGSPVARTLVAERDGVITGFSNFHILPFQGRTREPVGIIDIMAAKPDSTNSQRSLLSATLAHMRDCDAVLALKLRNTGDSLPLMLRTGFIPRLPDSHVVLQWTQRVREIPHGCPLHILWR